MTTRKKPARSIARNLPVFKLPAAATAPAPTPSALAVQIGGSHYKAMKIQPAEYCHANHIEKLEGDVIAYVSRWRMKNGIEDLRKARHTLDLLIELEEKANAA